MTPTRRGAGAATTVVVAGIVAMAMALVPLVLGAPGSGLWLHDRPGADPVATEIARLRAELAEDASWFARNERLMAGYGRSGEYARRVSLRAGRERALEALLLRQEGAPVDVPVAVEAALPGETLPHFPAPGTADKKPEVTP